MFPFMSNLYKLEINKVQLLHTEELQNLFELI